MDNSNSEFLKFCNVKEGIVGDKILCKSSTTSEKINTPKRLNGIFIVTLGYSENLRASFLTALSHSDIVYILTSVVTELVLELEQCGAIIVHFGINSNNDLLNLSSSQNPSLKYNQTFDIPTKRNFAIKYSKEREFKNIAVFDDDIMITPSLLLLGATSLQNGSDIAACYSLYYPDISITDIIKYRHLDVSPEVTISGNAMFLKVCNIEGFFPYLYNEDWLFFITNQFNGLVVKGITDVAQIPKVKNPFARVQFEQFGETISKGITNLQYKRNLILPEELGFWSEVYKGYICDLEQLRHETDNSMDDMVLTKAISALNEFGAQDLVLFSKNFNEDVVEYKERGLMHNESLCVKQDDRELML